MVSLALMPCLHDDDDDDDDDDDGVIIIIMKVRHQGKK